MLVKHTVWQAGGMPLGFQVLGFREQTQNLNTYTPNLAAEPDYQRSSRISSTLNLHRNTGCKCRVLPGGLALSQGSLYFLPAGQELLQPHEACKHNENLGEPK